MIDFMTARSTLSALTRTIHGYLLRRPIFSPCVLRSRTPRNEIHEHPGNSNSEQAACLIYNALVLGRSLRFFQELRQCANCSTRIEHGPRESKTIQY